MILPGGLLVNGRLERTVAFKPLTGQVEQSLYDSDKAASLPCRVSRALSRTVASIGKKKNLDTAVMSALSVGDRQFLMMRLCARFFGDVFWMTGTCLDCDTAFDIRMERSAIPVKAAGRTYPYVSLSLDGRKIKAVVPRGRDQERIDGLEDDQAVKRLLALCLVSVDGRKPPENFADTLSSRHWDLLDEAFESVSPLVATRVETVCPACSTPQIVDIDPYGLDGFETASFYNEVHLLASTYHWGEREILDLPRERRHLYIKLIDRSSGRSS